MAFVIGRPRRNKRSQLLNQDHDKTMAGLPLNSGI